MRFATLAAMPGASTTAAPAHNPWPWVLGIQCWLVWVIGPRLFRGLFDPVATVLSFLPAAVLGLALVLERRGRHAALLTLGCFPASLALAVVGFDPQRAMATYSPAVLVVGTASLLAYAGAAAQGGRPDLRLRECSVHPLGQSHQPATDPRRALAQRLLLGGCFLALAGLVIWSGHGSSLRYHDAWGEGAAAGATLVATLSGLTGAVAMAGVVGPALRAERPRGSQSSRERRQRRRVLWLLAVALSGGATYAMVQLSGR